MALILRFFMRIGAYLKDGNRENALNFNKEVSMLKKIDHLVITTSQIEPCLKFYKALGFNANFTNNRYELLAQDFKINVHVMGRELSPHAKNIQTGSADFCIEVQCIEDFKQCLERQGIEIELGIVNRTGVKGSMKSIYLRDPDGNLLEFCSY